MMQSTQPQGPRDRQPWRPERTVLIAYEGEELRFSGKALVVDRSVVSSVTGALEMLNSGRIHCPDGFCVVYSAKIRGYYLCYVGGKRHASLRALNMLDDHLQRLAEAPSQAAGCLPVNGALSHVPRVRAPTSRHSASANLPNNNIVSIAHAIDAAKATGLRPAERPEWTYSPEVPSENAMPISYSFAAEPCDDRSPRPHKLLDERSPRHAPLSRMEDRSPRHSPPNMEERSPRRTPEHSRSRCFSPHQPMVRGRSPLQTPPRQQGTQKPIMARGRSPQHTPPPFLNSEERSPHHTPQHTKYGQFAPRPAVVPPIVEMKRTSSRESRESTCTLSPATVCPSPLSRTLPPGCVYSAVAVTAALSASMASEPTQCSSPSRLSPRSYGFVSAELGAAPQSARDFVDQCRRDEGQRGTVRAPERDTSRGRGKDDNESGRESLGSSPTILMDTPRSFFMNTVMRSPSCEEGWTTDKSCRVGMEGDEQRFGRVQVLDPARVCSVNAAISQLNANELSCFGEHCIVWSASGHSYYMLWRRGTLEDALSMLNEQPPAQPPVPHAPVCDQTQVSPAASFGAERPKRKVRSHSRTAVVPRGTSPGYQPTRGVSPAGLRRGSPPSPSTPIHIPLAPFID